MNCECIRQNHRQQLAQHGVVGCQGILSPEDARKAVDAGVDGIVVSNHGGRQLDYSPATLDMIAPIRAAVGHRVLLLMDGGIRRGTDVLKVTLRLCMDVVILATLLPNTHTSWCGLTLSQCVHHCRSFSDRGFSLLTQLYM